MKRLLLYVLSLVACSATASAQQYMRIWSAGDYVEVLMAEAGDMTTSAGTLTVGGTSYDIAAIDSITVGARVRIDYKGTEAAVSIPSMVDGVTAEVSGSDVTISNTNVTDELEFVLSGASQNGSFTYNGAYKTTILLDGLNLKSNTTAAINIQCGKRISMRMGDGTTNMLEDSEGGSQKAALYCKGHLELGGTGTLTVKGNSAHAISTKEYLEVKRSLGGLTVSGSAKDGVHVGQYLQVNGSEITVSGNKGDAIQVERLLDDSGNPDATKELNGQCIIKGGTITAECAYDDTSVLKADGDISISDGTLNLTATGAGTRGIDADANVVISGGTLNLTATGAKYKDPATGDSSRCRLGKVDGDMTLSGCKLVGKYTDPAKGMKVVGTLTIETSSTTATGMGWEYGKFVSK